VTGAAHGIGQAIAAGLAERGARIVLGDIGDVSETSDLIGAAGRPAVPVMPDVSDRSSTEAAREAPCGAEDARTSRRMIAGRISAICCATKLPPARRQRIDQRRIPAVEIPAEVLQQNQRHPAVTRLPVRVVNAVRGPDELVRELCICHGYSRSASQRSVAFAVMALRAGGWTGAVFVPCWPARAADSIAVRVRGFSPGALMAAGGERLGKRDLRVVETSPVSMAVRGHGECDGLVLLHGDDMLGGDHVGAGKRGAELRPMQVSASCPFSTLLRAVILGGPTTSKESQKTHSAVHNVPRPVS